MAGEDLVAEAKAELRRRGMDGDTKALEQYIRSEGGYVAADTELPDLSSMSMDELKAEFMELVGMDQ